VRVSYLFATARQRLQLFIQQPFYLAHIIVTNRIGLSVIPINGDFAPRRADNDPKIVGRCGPADLIAYFEKSGLLAVHLRFTLRATASSTRCIPLWPEKLLCPSCHVMVTYCASTAVTLPLSAGSPLKMTRSPTCSCLDCSGVINESFQRGQSIGVKLNRRRSISSHSFSVYCFTPSSAKR
jgi:hypothetical protein